MKSQVASSRLVIPMRQPDSRLAIVQQGDLYLVKERVPTLFGFRTKWKTIFTAANEQEAAAVHSCRWRELGLPCFPLSAPPL